MQDIERRAAEDFRITTSAGGALLDSSTKPAAVGAVCAPTATVTQPGARVRCLTVRLLGQMAMGCPNRRRTLAQLPTGVSPLQQGSSSNAVAPPAVHASTPPHNGVIRTALSKERAAEGHPNERILVLC